MTITGSPVFWILLVLAVVAVITYLERLMDFRRARVDYQDFLEGVINILEAGNDSEALVVCEDTGVPVANVVATAIRHRDGTPEVLREAVNSQGRAEIGRLDRRLATIAIMGQIAPALGLLGTILGFARTVLKINSVEVVSRADLMVGVMDSLVVAAAGLAVSIVTTVMYGSLRTRLERTTLELEAAASRIVGYVMSRKNREDAK